MFGLGQESKTIVLAKPYCIPARGIVKSICQQYGVKILGFTEQLHYFDDIPGLYISRLKVKATQAEWTEYLLLRSQKFMLFSKPLNKRNLEWASRHKLMPLSWNGKPLIEVGCKELDRYKRK